ncbi:MAG: acyl--CoA ligase [Oligoflexia bacterium]|nr:acyl--CoA ligase [Oligoflexia bacterium]
MNYHSYNHCFESIVERYSQRMFHDIDAQIVLNSKEFKHRAHCIQDQILTFTKGKRRQLIGVTIDDSLLNVISYFAVILSGNVYVPLSQSLTNNELLNLLKHSNISVVITDNPINISTSVLDVAKIEVLQVNCELLKKNTKDLSLLESIINKSGDLDDEIEIFFTSGTTGAPKGVVHSQKSRILNAEEVGKFLKFGSEDNLLSFLPLTHTASWTYVISPGFVSGSNLYLSKKFSKKNFWNIIEKYRITYVQVVPTILMMLLNDPAQVSSEQTKSLKFIGCGSAPLPIDVLVKFEEVFGVRVVNLYGLSETGPTHYIAPDDSKKYNASLGLPFDQCEVIIVDNQDIKCGPLESGEILVSGPNLMKGYFLKNNGERLEVRSSFDYLYDKRWFRTGDIGVLDHEGYLYLRDRKKDIIIKGGVNIYPSEIDDILFRHPGVLEACTIGINDGIYGEEIIAYVIPRDHFFKEEDIFSFCKEKIESFKCPKKIVFIDSIPKGPTGKILRRKLLEKYLINNELT